ncbi:MAG: Fur family transcriptional regulator [Chloroflexota bacterium]|nr:Fur family transcriptional regulator [Chloroflexota bacterium]
MKTIEDIRERLKACGLRVTSQRLLVLQILEESREHLDVKTIYGRARARDPNLSLATVYRTLGRLREMGLVELCYLARDRRRAYYEAKDKGEHYHFTCLGCGRIIEVHAPCVEQACREVAEKLGLELTRANVCLEGYCPACAAKGDD